MSLDIELRDGDCAQTGCAETIKEIRSPASSKYQPPARRVRGRILLCPVSPVSQQIGCISLSLPCLENQPRLRTSAPKNNSSAVQAGAGRILQFLSRFDGMKRAGPDQRQARLSDLASRRTS